MDKEITPEMAEQLRKPSMKKLLLKLKEARNIIKSSNLKKKGRNDYSNFDYYTPEQVDALVDNACDKTAIMVLCNLLADEYGLYQTLDLIDMESEEKLHFEMRTKHGSITATNETQQMGGTDTYSERYIKMKVFQIKDNNLDCDTPQRPQRPQEPRTATKRPDTENPSQNYNNQVTGDFNNDKPWITDEQFKEEIKKLVDKKQVTIGTDPKAIMKGLRAVYAVARKYEDMIEQEINNCVIK